MIQQLRDCLTVKCLNISTGQLELPKNVLLITTYDFPDKDLQGSDHLLQTPGRPLRFIGPDEFAALIQKHLPEYYLAHCGLDERIRLAHEQIVESSRPHTILGFNKTTSEPFYIRLGITQDTNILRRIESGELIPEPDGHKLYIERREKDIIWLQEICSFVQSIAAINSEIIEYQSQDLYESGRRRLMCTVDYVRVALLVEGTTKHVRKEMRSRSSGYFSRSMLSLGMTDLILELFESHFNGDLFLDTIKSPQRDSILHNPASNKARQKTIKIGLNINDIPPDEFTNLSDNIAILGTAGAGKTSLAQAIYLSASEQGRIALYYPCFKMVNKNEPLLTASAHFWAGIAE